MAKFTSPNVQYLGVRVSLRFFFSFRLNKNNPRDFFTDQ